MVLYLKDLALLLGGYIKGLSYVLDTLSRELGVLFIVSAGNVPGIGLVLESFTPIDFNAFHDRGRFQSLRG